MAGELDAAQALVAALLTGGIFSGVRWWTAQYGFNPEKWDWVKFAPMLVLAFVIWAIHYALKLSVADAAASLDQWVPVPALVLIINAVVALIQKRAKAGAVAPAPPPPSP